MPGVQVPIAGDRRAPLPWTLTVSGAEIGSDHVPGTCVTFLFAWGPGQKIGNGFPYCIAPASGLVTSHGTQWSFNLDAAGFDGVVPYATGGTGIGGIVVLAVPQARSIRAVFADGEVVALEAHPLPVRAHRAAAIAYRVTIDPRRFSTQFRWVSHRRTDGENLTI